MKKFDIPNYYKSSIISKIKSYRAKSDPRKKDYTPTELDFGPVVFYIARHFGFCYGVENAIEIAYKTIDANPGKRIFLLSEMIHNPHVNSDLLDKGVRFIMDNNGRQLIDWSELDAEDIILIPAFGTNLEIESKIRELGISTEKYNTTCPFVEKVWNRAVQLGSEDYTVIIHGKHNHEETRATFSHSKENAPSVIIRDIAEAKILGGIILGERPVAEFYTHFSGKYSSGFIPEKHLNKIGVVNQTTMLASETDEIAEYFKYAMIRKFGEDKIDEHFADTRDTLCYATNDNQKATYGLLEVDADFAVVIGGYNSSNTSHIVNLLERNFTTYFISSEEKIFSSGKILHYDLSAGSEKLTLNFIPRKPKVKIVITSGASCPDALVDGVIEKLHSFFPSAEPLEKAEDLLK